MKNTEQKMPKIYVFKLTDNPKFDGYLKVGYTTKNPKDRIIRQFGTLLQLDPEAFEIVYVEESTREDGTLFRDYEVHKILKSYGIKSRGEWFMTDLDEIKRAIREVKIELNPELYRRHLSAKDLEMDRRILPNKVKRKLTFDLDNEQEKEMYFLLEEFNGPGVNLLLQHLEAHKNFNNCEADDLKETEPTQTVVSSLKEIGFSSSESSENRLKALSMLVDLGED